MGARIAAHLANATVPCVLLDVVPTALSAEERRKGLSLHDARVRNRLAQSGLDAALQSRPPAFFVPEGARLVTVGNCEDHLGWLKDCDWILEAVVEDVAIKRALLAKVEPFRAPHAIVSSNTSGIPLTRLAAGLSEDFRRHFLGTHFFNPPRYLKLLEVIPTPDTLPDIVADVSRFADLLLGKGVVVAKDTPGFIANRIGIFFTLHVLRIMQEEGYTLEEIDALTGPALGLPKSATFRLLDIVGLDVLARVVQHLAGSLPEDECRALFQLPEFCQGMLERNLLGDKTGKGFYQKVRTSSAGAGDDESEILTLDLRTFEYRKRQKPALPTLEMAQGIEDTRQRVATLFAARDRVGRFYQKLLSETCHYATSRIPEIADDIVSVDNALKWGFNWQCGLFELADAIGVPNLVNRWRADERPIPPLVEKLLASPRCAFYVRLDGTPCHFDFARASHRPIADRPGVVVLSSLKARQKEIQKNAGASLIDLGDGVVCLEFHSKMNTLGPDAVGMIHGGLQALHADFEALVIANDGANFSAGANLMLLLATIQEGEWEEIRRVVRAFQNANLALKCAPRPVVAAPHGLTLGGGAEICLHAARVRAAAETYMGLVEASVGLIPGAGGTKEMLIRAMEGALPSEAVDPFQLLKEIFLNIGKAKISTSAEDARKLRYLAERDSISLNGDRRIADAKRVALDLVKLGYRPALPREDVLVLGQSAFAKMKLTLHLLHRAEYISDYDVVVGTRLARVLSGGGEFTSPQRVSEQYLLDLECEAFLSLCGEKRTVERIQHMLKRGKPLRN
jgi:3-hydroxyacyl-CoA dehydrogenase